MDNSINNSIYTVSILPEYKEFASSLLAISSILIVLHLLMSNQKSVGFIGKVFNSPFSDTFMKILVSISFYYLVVKKLVIIV